MFAVAGQLPAHLPQGVLAAAALELVDRHRSGEVEHVDLLQLGGGAELRRHHVEGEVDVWDHGGVPLADARRLHDDEVEAGGLAGRDGLVETGGQLGPRAPGGEGPEIDRPPTGTGTGTVEPPAAGSDEPACGGARSLSMEFMRIRSPSSAPPPLRRVGSTASTATRSLSSWSTRNRRTSSSVSEDFPDPPVPVMPSTGARCRAAAVSIRWRAAASSPSFSAAVMRRARAPMVTPQQRLEVPGLRGWERMVAASHHGVDHGGQPHGLAILGREDAGHPVALQVLDLGRHDGAASPAVDLHVSPAGSPQAIHQVEKYSTWPPW